MPTSLEVRANVFFLPLKKLVLLLGNALMWIAVSYHNKSMKEVVVIPARFELSTISMPNII